MSSYALFTKAPYTVDLAIGKNTYRPYDYETYNKSVAMAREFSKEKPKYKAVWWDNGTGNFAVFEKGLLVETSKREFFKTMNV